MQNSTLKEKIEIIICIVVMIIALAFLIAAINYMTNYILAGGCINWSEQ